MRWMPSGWRRWAGHLVCHGPIEDCRWLQSVFGRMGGSKRGGGGNQ